MLFEHWADVASRHRRSMTLLALLSAAAGVALIIDPPKGTVLEWLALPFLVIGGSTFVWAVGPRIGPPAESPPSLASHFLQWITRSGRLVRLFPAFGVGLILADLGYNLVLSASPAFQTEDTIVLLAALSFLAYGFVPARYARERDFVLVFFLTLNAILVGPLLIARTYYADFEKSVDIYSWVALAPQTSAVLQLMGVSNSVHAVAGSTAPGLTFTPQHLATQVTIVITTACSGIYSFGIFAAAFTAYVLTEYERPSRRVWLLLCLGFATSYVANVLRMAAIVLVGYYTDTVQTDLQNMLVAHSYAGWIIFLGWLALFWTILLKLIGPVETLRKRSPEPGKKPIREPSCGSCGRTLTPALPALRCACGSYYHKECLRGRPCSRCGRQHGPELARDRSPT